MDDKEKLSVSLYSVLVAFRDTLTLPTDATLEKTLKLSCLLTACSGLSTLLGFYTFVSWQGCLLCTLILIALLWKERSENDALLRMYRDARVSAQKAAQRAKDAGARINNGRRSGSNGSDKQETGERKRSQNINKDKGRNGSSGRSKNAKGRTGANRRNENGTGKRR